MNRKQIIRSIIFIVLVLFLLVRVTYAIRTNGDVKDRFVGFYAEKNNTLDAVIIGSSPVYPAFATPKIYGDMGVAMYPLSSNMQRPVATRYLVKEVEKSQNPELYIFEMRMWTAADEDILGNMAHTREVTDNMKYSLNRIDTINAMVADKKERLTYYFDIFKYHSNWKTLALWSQLRTCFYSYPSPLKGHEVLTSVGPCEESGFEHLTDKEPMPSEQEAYLRDLLDYLKAENINALFVITPYMVKEHEQKRINYMADIITGYGYEFVDMNQHNDEIGLDYSMDFRDYGTHTNCVGAVKVTEWFEDYIKDNYMDTGICFQTDHRGDKRYNSWGKAFELWQEEYLNGAARVSDNIRNEVWYETQDE